MKFADELILSSVPIVRGNATIGDVEELLIERIREFDAIHYIYILDDNGKLKGVMSLKEIFRSPKQAKVKDLYPKKLVKAHQHATREKVAFLALKHRLKEIPVVDSSNRFLGVVPADAILEIIDSEAVENLLRLGGVAHVSNYDDVFHLSLLRSLKHRLPWLIVGLLGGVLASGIVGNFESVLAKNIILAAFIPLIVYMSDAVGTQMEAFIIRDLAVNENLKFPAYFLRQMSIVLMVGVILSSLLYVGGLFFFDDPRISLVVALALFFAIISSLITGLVIPFIFSKFKMDPANASGPIATIIQDLMSVFIYFSIASFLLL